MRSSKEKKERKEGRNKGGGKEGRKKERKAAQDDKNEKRINLTGSPPLSLGHLF